MAFGDNLERLQAKIDPRSEDTFPEPDPQEQEVAFDEEQREDADKALNTARTTLAIEVASGLGHLVNSTEEFWTFVSEIEDRLK
jgi:hypothetical protein